MQRHCTNSMHYIFVGKLRKNICRYVFRERIAIADMSDTPLCFLKENMTEHKIHFTREEV